MQTIFKYDDTIICTNIIAMSRTKEVDLIFFIFSFSFYFIFDLFSFIPFLEPGLGLE